MLTAKSSGIFSSTYRLMNEGKEVALLDTSGWREEAELHLGDRGVTFYRQKLFSGPFLLVLDEKTIAHAVKPSAFRDRFELHLGHERCHINKQGLLGRTFTVTRVDEKDGDDERETVIGRVAREGWFSNNATVDLPDDWPLPLQAFVYWLVLLLWRRMEAAAGG